MKANKILLGFLALLFINSCLASTLVTSVGSISGHVNYWISVFYCLLLFVLSGISVLVMALSGVKIMTAENLEERKEAKRRLKFALAALMFILITCPVVNYIINGFRLEEFACNCPP